MDTPLRKRVQSARRRMEEAKVTAFVVTRLPNVFYLCGFTGSAGVLVLEPGAATFLTDSRYIEQAHAEVHGARVRICRTGVLAAVGELLRASKHSRVAFEASHTTVGQLSSVRGWSGRGIRWVPSNGWVEGIRSLKDAAELVQMRKAAELGVQAFEEVLSLVRPGIREFELAAEIEYRMRRGGASGPSFETIVASGPRSALPHARATAKRLRKGELVVLDLGAILGQYCSDLTRTVYLGKAPNRVRKWYKGVWEAQAAARQALRPGVRAGEVDAAAREVLRRHGLDRYFVHSTGHGLGLEVHEDPRLAKGQEAVLQPGSVVTVEPGVYFPGVGGIRIEDDVAMSGRGVEILTRPGGVAPQNEEILQL